MLVIREAHTIEIVSFGVLRSSFFSYLLVERLELETHSASEGVVWGIDWSWF